MDLHTTSTNLTQNVTMRSGDGTVSMTFDLAAVDMTGEQAVLVQKLFRQNPTAEVTTEPHRHEDERGKEGPGSRYLDMEEFAQVRELGVRLGVDGDLVATACDFCLHCVKLEAMPNWNGGYGA